MHLIWHLFCSGCTSHCTTCTSDWQCDECSPGYHLQAVDSLSCPGRALCIIIQQFTTMHFCFPQHLVAVHSVWCSSHLDCPDGCSTCAGSLDKECSECLPGFYYLPYTEDTGYCIGINTPLPLSSHPHTNTISNGRIQYFVLFHITMTNKINIIYVFNLKCVCSAVIFAISCLPTLQCTRWVFICFIFYLVLSNILHYSSCDSVMTISIFSSSLRSSGCGSRCLSCSSQTTCQQCEAGNTWTGLECTGKYRTGWQPMPRNCSYNAWIM